MPTTRRQFLARCAALGVAPLVVPASAIGAEGAAPPSSRIGLGFIGVGAMGSGHLRCCVAYPDVQVRAACDVDRWRRERAKATVEDAYTAQGRAARCDAHNDLRELLARPDIDAVAIATGDRWHGLATVLAAQAGKDVYCEKPISLTIAEAQAMAAAVRRYGRVCQIGLQQRSTPEFIRACQLVRAGALGAVRIVYVNMPGTSDDVSLPAEPVPEGLDWDLWLGPAPWRPYHHRFHPYGQWHGVVPWHFCRDFGGGNLTSNTVHAFDVVQWGLGMDASGPVEITPPETGRVPLLTYRYASGVLCQVVHGRLPRQREFKLEGWDEATPVQNFGAVFVGDAGWLHVGREGYLRSQQPPSGLVQLHPRAAAPGVRRGGRGALHHRLPPRLHRPLAGPPAPLGPRPRGVPRRRRGQPPPLPPHAPALADLNAGHGPRSWRSGTTAGSNPPPTPSLAGRGVRTPLPCRERVGRGSGSGTCSKLTRGGA